MRVSISGVRNCCQSILSAERARASATNSPTRQPLETSYSLAEELAFDNQRFQLQRLPRTHKLPSMVDQSNALKTSACALRVS